MRKTDGPPLRLRLTTPADLLGAIPYLLGFHPAESIVLLAARERRILFTVRADLPAPANRNAIADQLSEAALAHAASAVLIVGYGADERVRPVIRALRRTCERAGLAVLEVLRAADGRYWSELCHDPACCPPEGARYDPIASPVAAQVTVEGLVALPDRAAFERQIEPLAGDRVGLRRAEAAAEQRLLDLVATESDRATIRSTLAAAGLAAVDAAIASQRNGHRLTDDEAAWLALMLVGVAVRDAAWLRIGPDPAELLVHRTLWLDVFRRAGPHLTAAPGSLFAFAAWRRGEVALARLALERVLTEDPGYPMAVLLDEALAQGMAPAVLGDWPATRPTGGSAARVRSRVSRPPGTRPRRRSSSGRAGSPRA